jgi:hypothetical protein
MVNYVETGHIPDTAELLAIACKRNALGVKKKPGSESLPGRVSKAYG